MRKIELICVGELKSRELKVIEKEYLKKIGYFTKLEPIILKDIDIQDEAVKKEKESRSMLEILNKLDKLDKNDFVVALDEKGKQMDSLEFSRFLAEKFTYHPGRIVFLLGGHAGLAELLDSRIDFKLSFSAMTIAHDISRIVFLEQLYRAFTIMKGIKYHR